MPRRNTRKQRGGSWGAWSAYPGALTWGPGQAVPPPLPNGGQYTGPQSTGAWASTPFPATLYGWQVAAAQAAGNPDVFYHQRPNDNSGASFSPYVGTPISPLHSEPMYKPASGGRRHHRRAKTNKNKRRK